MENQDISFSYIADTKAAVSFSEHTIKNAEVWFGSKSLEDVKKHNAEVSLEIKCGMLYIQIGEHFIRIKPSDKPTAYFWKPVETR